MALSIQGVSKSFGRAPMCLSQSFASDGSGQSCEPLNNLDIFYARELMQQLRALVDERGRTIAIVLHDINQAAAYADRIVAMKDGHVLGCGSPNEIVTTENL